MGFVCPALVVAGDDCADGGFRLPLCVESGTETWGAFTERRSQGPEPQLEGLWYCAPTPLLRRLLLRWPCPEIRRSRIPRHSRGILRIRHPLHAQRCALWGVCKSWSWGVLGRKQVISAKIYPYRFLCQTGIR